MANLLEVGVEFESFDAFQAAMEQYEDANFVQFSRIDSRSVEKAQETSFSKTYNPQIKFSQLTYACTFGPRKGTSKSTGVRNSISRKIDCPVRMRISATSDGQRLAIRESKLDCHNHEISEEQYQSLARQKQLDEETEMEIYSLISTHDDKRLARMLVRDKLTKETGRAMSIKDILNIEKKVNRKLELEKRSEGSGNNDSDTRESEEVKDSADVENEEQKTAESPQSPKEEIESTEKEKPSPTTRSKQTGSSVGRPQRNRREPRRFRDALENGIKILHTSKDNVVSFISPDEANAIEFNSSSTNIKKLPVKVKEEPSPKGKKRKIHDDEEHPDTESIQERKLAIKEELFEMEKNKMIILQEIVKKLDKIIENQEHR
uniref:ZSWIM3 N-terminal domain-containing protein n=1 Tax=Arion vulgaris TaxID=1028688 RepID=A0A0B6YSI8_9EUPU